MKITITTHGGLAAGIRRQSQVVDTSTMSTSDAEELGRLVAAAKATSPAEAQSPGQARDAMSYTVTVEEAGASAVIRQSDTTMTPEFARLMEWLGT